MLICFDKRAVGRQEGRLEEILHVHNLFSCSFVVGEEFVVVEFVVVEP
jgi:hypothetical protein